MGSGEPDKNTTAEQIEYETVDEASAVSCH